MYGLDASVNHNTLYKAEGLPQAIIPQDTATQWTSNEDGQLSTFPDGHTVRLLMSGKEVGSIIGKKGVNIKKYREESGARINISDVTTPERIVTIVGNIEQIQTALSLMCHKFEEDVQQNFNEEELSQGVVPPLTLRLLVPGAQCGSIIGKGGCKIKEIRETTSASIQVASDVLPQSTERVITVSGTARSISLCIKVISETLQSCPNKIPVVPYKPKPVLGMNVLLPGALSPAFLPGAVSLATNFGGADLIKGLMSTAGAPLNAFTTSQPPDSSGNMALAAVQQSAALSNGLSAAALLPLSINVAASQSIVAANPLAMFPGISGLTLPQHNLSALSAAGFPLNLLSTPPTTPSSNQGQHTQDLIIPNELIGCVIGRAGNKINEIRQSSGAQIKISNVDNGSGRDRKITISGTAEQVQFARILIQQSIEAHRQMLTLNMLANGNAAANLASPMQIAPFNNAMSTVDSSSIPHPYLNSTNSASLAALIANSNAVNGLLGDVYSTAIHHPQSSFLTSNLLFPSPATSVAGGSASTYVSFPLAGVPLQQASLPSAPTSSPVQTTFVPKMKTPLSASAIPKYSPY